MNQAQQTKKFLDNNGYAVIRAVPFSPARLDEIRELSINCIDKAMREVAATKEENAALCKLALLSMSLDDRINKDYRFNHSMIIKGI